MPRPILLIFYHVEKTGGSAVMKWLHKMASAKEWETGAAKDMTEMFLYATSFNQPLGWCGVTATLANAFVDAKFLGAMYDFNTKRKKAQLATFFWLAKSSLPLWRPAPIRPSYD